MADATRRTWNKILKESLSKSRQAAKAYATGMKLPPTDDGNGGATESIAEDPVVHRHIFVRSYNNDTDCRRDHLQAGLAKLWKSDSCFQFEVLPDSQFFGVAEPCIFSRISHHILPFILEYFKRRLVYGRRNFQVPSTKLGSMY